MIQKRFIPSFCLFIVLVFFSFDGNTKTTWLINPTKIPSFTVAKQQEFTEVLSDSGIKVIYDTSLKTEATSSVCQCSQLLTPLMKGRHVTVYLITPSLEELHIGIGVKDLLTLKGEALQEFNDMVKNVAASFQELGYGDYLAFCNFDKTYHFPPKEENTNQCWEMIPLGKGYVESKNGDYQLAPKIWRNNYVLSNQCPAFKPTNHGIVKQFVKLLKSHLDEQVPYPPSFYKETLPWKVRIPDWEETKQATLKRLLMSLQELGAVKVLESSKDQSPRNPAAPSTKVEGEFNVTYEKDRESCTFCKQSVLKKQEMICDQDMTILYNYLPYTENAHFMVVPFQHKENFHHLENHHMANTIQWAQKISLILGDKKNLIWFCQNGPYAGQTTPHFHFHILHRPNSVLFPLQILKELSGNKSKPVGEEAYKINRDRIVKGLSKLPQ